MWKSIQNVIMFSKMFVYNAIKSSRFRRTASSEHVLLTRCLRTRSLKILYAIPNKVNRKRNICESRAKIGVL
jgi:hypothetical protein